MRIIVMSKLCLVLSGKGLSGDWLPLLAFPPYRYLTWCEVTTYFFIPKRVNWRWASKLSRLLSLTALGTNRSAASFVYGTKRLPIYIMLSENCLPLTSDTALIVTPLPDLFKFGITYTLGANVLSWTYEVHMVQYVVTQVSREYDITRPAQHIKKYPTVLS